MSEADMIPDLPDLLPWVVEQLTWGSYRAKDDSGPGDWLARAWCGSSGVKRILLGKAIHQALLFPRPEVRIEAIRILDGNERMADPDRLLEAIEGHWEEYQGLRARDDPESLDYGRSLLQLALANSPGERGRKLRERFALDPRYGIHALAGLAEHEPEWVAERIPELVEPSLDPTGARLSVLIHNLGRRPAFLKTAVAKLRIVHPSLRERLDRVIVEEIDQEELLEELLGGLKG